MKFIAIIGISLALGGCAAQSLHTLQATPTQQRFELGYINQNLVSGKTTADEVISRFGSPSSREVSAGGEERWIYTKPQQQSGGGVLGMLELLPPSMQNKAIGQLRQNEHAVDVLSMADTLLSGQTGSSAGSAANSLTVYLKKNVVTRFSY